MTPVTWSSNAAGRVCYVGPTWRAVAGFPWHDALANQWWDWLSVHDVDRFRQSWVGAHRHRMPLIERCHLMLPTGREVHALVRAVPDIIDGQFGGLRGSSLLRQL